MEKAIEASFQMEMDIEKCVSEGWKFRVKEVGGHRYITRYRKGEEKSLGPYSDELWKQIVEKAGDRASQPRRKEALLSEIEGLKERVKRLEGFEESARRKCESCPQIGSWYGYRYCKLLSWDRKPTKLMNIYPQFEFMRIMPDRVEERWYVEPHPDLCRTCASVALNPDLIKEQLHRINEFTSLLPSIKTLIGHAEDTGGFKAKNCAHMDKEGYCTYWRWPDPPTHHAKNHKRNVEGTYHISAGALFCADCHAFKKRGEIDLSELQSLINSSFEIGTCDNCSKTVLMPKFLDRWICPYCSSHRGWKKESIKKIRPLAPNDYQPM